MWPSHSQWIYWRSGHSSVKILQIIRAAFRDDSMHEIQKNLGPDISDTVGNPLNVIYILIRLQSTEHSKRCEGYNQRKSEIDNVRTADTNQKISSHFEYLNWLFPVLYMISWQTLTAPKTVNTTHLSRFGLV